VTINLRPYAGRWVALVQGRVAGVGLTAEAARIAAQLSRPKEKPQVIFVPERPDLAFPSLLDDIRRALPDARIWLVGGAVRDALLNRRVQDLDFAVEGDALAAARQTAHALNASFYPLDSERDVGRVIVTRDEARFTLDFARLRGPDPSALLSVAGQGLAADLAARDFTINAIAVSLADPETLIDPLNGEADLRAKIIRACSPHSIADDPVRAVRAIRLAAQLDFRLDQDTRAAVRAQAGALARTSPERRRDEFIRCLGNPRAAAALRALERLGLLEHLAPEVLALKGVTQSPPHELDAWEHTLATVARLEEVLAVLGPVHDVDAASDLTLGLVSVRLGRFRQNIAGHLRTVLSGDRPARWLLMLAALLHDVGKPQTRTVEPDGRIRFLNHEVVGAEMTARRLARLHFSADEVRRAKTIIVHHMRARQLSKEGSPTRRAIYRFFHDTGEAGVDIVLLSLADFLAKTNSGPPPQDEWDKHLGVCAQLLGAYFERPQESVSPPALITGHDLIAEFGLEAGPRIGKLLEAVREAQAAGDIADRAGALAFVQKRLAEE
jgi:putative nucleotidyltransferase with HDIG domain